MWNKYNYINTIEKIKELDKFLMNEDGTKKFELISYDTETNGLRIHKNTIVGFSLSVDSDRGWYIPLLEWIPDKNTLKIKSKNKVKYEVYTEGHLKCVWSGKIYPEFFTPKDYEMPEMIPVLIERWFKGAKLIMHNAPFDVLMTAIATGVDLGPSVIMDTALLSHILNENTPNALKATAAEWSKELGYNARQDATQEQKELGVSVFRNGGEVTNKMKPKWIWRADPEFMSKYANSDTFLTYGIYKLGIKKLIERFGEKGAKWIVEDEVMPVCKEVVMKMKRNGVYLDIPYFEKQEREVAEYLDKMEDKFMEAIGPYIQDFDKYASIEEEVKQVNIVNKIIELEGLKKPTKYDKKTDTHKETLTKGAVKKVYQEDPHWLWGYILGEDEIKYSDEKLERIKQEIYQEKMGRRYRFKISSDECLRWLFCDKLGFSKTDLPQTDSATKENPIPSMKAEVLNEHMLPKHEWIKYLMTYKKLKKLYSTYILPAINLNINGWLYMDMKQNGTVSGRFACGGGFNLQTLPRIEDEIELLSTCDKCNSNNVKIHDLIDALADRECLDCGYMREGISRASVVKGGFIAPPGYKIVNADYSSLEPRIFAFMSADPKLKEVYWKNLDLYSKVYCDMFDVNLKYSADPKAENFLKKVNPSARKETKPIVLGIPYGSKAYQVAILCDKYKEKLNKKTGKIEKRPDQEYGQWVIDKYLSTYPELHKYMEDMELQCVTKGYVESMFGRRRHFQYAPTIFKFLITKGLTHKDLVECKPWMLKTAEISCVSNLGNKMIFHEEELQQLVKDLGANYEEKVTPGGYWKWIRVMLIQDLNNAKNWPIQAGAGAITNRGMLETTRLFKENKLDAWIFLQVHDEISCYAKIDQAETVADLLRTGMEDNTFAKQIDVAMIADPVICDCLKDAK